MTLSLAALPPGRLHRPARRPAARPVAAGLVRSHPLQRLVRLLLVALTVLGVAALHTIGHAGAERLDTDATPPPAAVAVAPVLHAAIPAIVTGSGTQDDGCAGDGCTHQVAQPDRDRHGPSWWEVCLAILGALAAASLGVGVLLRITRIRKAEAAAGQRRPPPFLLGLRAGLTLTNLAVLRI